MPLMIVPRVRSLNANLRLISAIVSAVYLLKITEIKEKCLQIGQILDQLVGALAEMLANLITTKKCSFATLKSSKHRWTKIVLRNQSLSITRKLLDEKDKQIIKNFAQILSELILVGEAL